MVRGKDQTVIADTIPRMPVTYAIAVGMAVVYAVDPVIDSVSYLVLAPWMHGGFGHLWQNLAVYLILGVWVEKRVGSWTYLKFVSLVPYMALYVPVALDIGGLSQGASGLTKALGGYVGLAVFVGLFRRLESIEVDWRWVLVAGLYFVVLVLLGRYAMVTVERFFYLSPRPEGVAISAHFTGLVLGWLWFGYRGLRYGVYRDWKYW